MSLHLARRTMGFTVGEWVSNPRNLRCAGPSHFQLILHFGNDWAQQFFWTAYWGPSINDVMLIFRVFGPPYHAFTQPISTVCHASGNPPSPPLLELNIIYGWSLAGLTFHVPISCNLEPLLSRVRHIRGHPLSTSAARGEEVEKLADFADKQS